jgi:hypothetical protein
LFWEICQEFSHKFQSFRINKEENKKVIAEIQKNRRWIATCKELLVKNVSKQSYEYARSKRENDKNQNKKWYFSFMDWKTRWEWTINETTNTSFRIFGVGNRSCYQNIGSHSYESKKELVQKEKCTDFLQSGCWKQRIEDSNRNRWKKSLFENETKTRQEERISFEMERVESVEIYERGSNDESFSGVIGDKERNQGYVEFYDLHVKENHSYIANDNMVHNSLTKPSQEALLKTLEEPPDYVFIAICTTNPEVLKQTFKRRCHHYDLQPLNFNELSFLIKRTLKAEKVPLQSFNIKVAEKIIEFAEGSAGQCMKLLDMVIDMKSTSNALKTLEAVGMGTGSPEVLDICRLLIDQKLNDKTRWMRISQVLKDLKTDGESARRPILGYLTTVLISSGRPDVAYVMECFLENYYDTGKSGLALSCFNACHKE